MAFYLHRFLFFIKNLLGRANELEKLIGLPIRKKEMFQRATMHGGDSKDNYERLEFLGDAVLETITSDYLFHTFIDSSEGNLTQMRSRLVRREALNILGYHIGLGNFIQSNYLEFDSINEENRRIFGDSLEALIGAVYLNSGYKGAKYFVTRKLIQPYVNDHQLLTQPNNFKGQLQQLAQKNNFYIQYDVKEMQPGKIEVELKINGKTFGYATAKNKKKAEQMVAQRALAQKQMLSKDYEILFKEED